jgi:putative ubiquitin-RnfH superfamily antitoxin RatB of RatAB toxin-antitoxin module
MDLRAYYQKIREAVAAIEEPFPIVMSLATADVGIAGTPVEVKRELAAKKIVEGTARLASPEEARQFRDGQAEAKRLADQAAAAAKVQLTVLTTADLNLLKNPGKHTEE